MNIYETYFEQLQDFIHVAIGRAHLAEPQRDVLVLYGEVVVEEVGQDGSRDSGCDRELRPLPSGDVREPEPGRVERVVVRRPDVQAQHQNGNVEQVQVQHHLENVVAPYVNA